MARRAIISLIAAKEITDAIGVARRFVQAQPWLDKWAKLAGFDMCDTRMQKLAAATTLMFTRTVGDFEAFRSRVRCGVCTTCCGPSGSVLERRGARWSYDS